MNTRAGDAFHQRKPTRLPASATDTMVRSSGSRTTKQPRIAPTLWQASLNWKKPMKMYADSARMVAPVASPSRPSVTFTACKKRKK